MKAKTEQHFRAVWSEHIDEIGRLAHSLPVKSIPKLNQTMEQLRLLLTEACVYTYPAPKTESERVQEKLDLAHQFKNDPELSQAFRDQAFDGLDD